MKRKLLSIVLALCLTLTLLPTMSVAAGSYGDTAGHWAESSIERWSAYGIIQGSNGQFDPNGQLTCAQLATILAKLLKLPAAKDAGFTDNTADAWYYDAINRCAAAGILNGNGDGTVTPEAPISRERAMVMLGRALGIEPIREPDLTKYTDAAKVAPYAQGMVAAMIEAGIVGGVTADELAPQDNINRASTVTILDRAISTYADEAGATVKADGKGIVLVVADDVTVTGDVDKLLIPADNVDVTVRGSKNIDDITVTGDNSKVILNNSTANDVTLDGKNTELETKSGSKVENVSVTEDAKGATVNAGSGTTVKNVENSAADTTVTGSGSVKNVASDTDVTVETKNTNVENRGDEKITVTDKNGKDTTVGTTGSGSSTTVNKETTSSGGGYSHSHSYVYTDNGDGTHTGRCYANDSTLAPEAHTIVGGKCTVCGAEQTDAAVASVKKSDGTYAYYTTLAAAINEADAGDTVTLVNNAETNSLKAGITYDLNGYKLTYTSSDSFSFSNQTTSFIGGAKGGTLDFPNIHSTNSAIWPNAGATLNVSDITVTCNGSAFYPAGDATALNITNCNVSSSVYCVGTNASSTDNYGVVITLKDSKFTSTASNGDSTAVIVNVACELVIDNCELTAGRQGLIVRAGTATVTNSTIKTMGAYGEKDKYHAAPWQSGNEVPAAALTVGNYVAGDANAYLADAIVTLENTKLIGGNDFPALYVDGNTSHIGKVSISGDAAFVSGAMMKGQQTAEGKATISITGGTFSSDPSAYVANGYGVKNENEVYTVTEPAAAINNKKYATLAAAINAAQSGDTVKLLRDAIGSGISTPDQGTSRESLTIDFDGHTYTMENPAVGSMGTETQAMHWGRTLGKITLKNGTFNVAQGATDVAMAMQNYINLDAEDMVLDFTNITVAHYAENEFESGSKWAKYNGKECPMFNNNDENAEIKLTRCTVTLPDDSTLGGNISGTLTLVNSTFNGYLCFNSTDGRITVDSDSSIKGDQVRSYFDGELNIVCNDGTWTATAAEG